MSYLIFIMVCIICIQGTYSNNNQTQDEVTRHNDGIRKWYGISEQFLKMCSFPFHYEHLEYKTCISMNYSLPKCPMDVVDYTPFNFEICTQVIEQNSANNVYKKKTYYLTASESGKCYSYTKHTSNMTYNGVLYAQLKTYQQCQLHCNSFYSCEGINFAKSSKYCFLVMDDNSTSYSTDEEVKHYSRSPCPTTIVNLQSTTEASGKHCNDTFVKKSNTKANGGMQYHDGITVELCKRECLYFKVRDSKDFCVGFDFDVNNVRCFLYNDASKFKVTNTSSKVHHYTRQDCLPVGYY